MCQQARDNASAHCVVARTGIEKHFQPVLHDVDIVVTEKKADFRAGTREPFENASGQRPCEDVMRPPPETERQQLCRSRDAVHIQRHAFGGRSSQAAHNLRGHFDGRQVGIPNYAEYAEPFQFAGAMCLFFVPTSGANGYTRARTPAAMTFIDVLYPAMLMERSAAASQSRNRGL